MAKKSKKAKKVSLWKKFWTGIGNFFKWIWTNLWKLLGLIAAILVLIFMVRFAFGYIEFVSDQTEPTVIDQTEPTVIDQTKPTVIDQTDLEMPDQRSAASNSNFIGYFGSRGKGWEVPAQVLDTNGNIRAVGAVIYSWCQTEVSCYYMVLEPGDIISEGHQGSQINIYSPEYKNLVANELQYIQTNQSTNWTIVQ